MSRISTRSMTHGDTSHVGLDDLLATPTPHGTDRGKKRAESPEEVETLLSHKEDETRRDDEESLFASPHKSSAAYEKEIADLRRALRVATSRGTDGGPSGEPPEDPDDDPDDDSDDHRSFRTSRRDPPQTVYIQSPAVHNQIRSTPAPRFDPQQRTPVKQWLFKMNLWFNASGIAYNQRVNQAALLLENHALTWWMARCNQGNQPIHWTNFSDQITRQFEVADTDRKAREELKNLRQIGRVSDYTAAFTNLTLTIPDLSEAEKFNRYLEGLKPEIRNEIRLRQVPTNLLDTMEAARRINEIRMEAYQGTSHHRFNSKRHIHAMTDKKDLTRVTCFNCQKLGHLARDCRKHKVDQKKKPHTKKGTTPIKNSREMNLIEVAVKKFDKSAAMPEYKTSEAAGADLYPLESGY